MNRDETLGRVVFVACACGLGWLRLMCNAGAAKQAVVETTAGTFVLDLASETRAESRGATS